MRRGIVLLSLGWSVLWIVFLNQFAQESRSEMSAWEQSTTFSEMETVSFPCTISGTNLLIEGMGMYEGPFPEDASNTPVTDVAALRIKNCSQNPIERGAVVLEIEGERYVFEIYGIPPGESVFVCELDKKGFTPQPVTACSGWAVEDVWLDTQSLLNIEQTGMGTLKITNISNQTLPYVQLLYKSYDMESGVYIGGILHTLDILSLQPGESRTVTPYRYVRGYSRIVTVKLHT